MHTFSLVHVGGDGLSVTTVVVVDKVVVDAAAAAVDVVFVIVVDAVVDDIGVDELRASVVPVNALDSSFHSSNAMSCFLQLLITFVLTLHHLVLQSPFLHVPGHLLLA